jgi:DNA-binding CsgD family transcriptional regulator
LTVHPKSIVEFGQFFSQVSDNVRNGAPLQHTLELIRDQFSAYAAVIAVESGSHAGEISYVVATRDGRLTDIEAGGHADSAKADGARQLSYLSDRCHFKSATHLGADETARYTLWVFRERSDAKFDQEESSVCEILVAQLARGLEMARRMGTCEVERMLFSDVMDRLYVGVVILDHSGKIVRASSTANQFLSARDGLQIQANRLRATCNTEDKAFQAAIKAALQSAANREAMATRGVSLTKRSGSRNLGVIVRPIVPSSNSPAEVNSAVAVYIRDSETNPEVEGELVRQLFDLTPAEAGVARRLTSGLSLEDAASSLAISRNTARAHLRSIFSKSGITRQTELVRLVLNSAVILGERAR